MKRKLTLIIVDDQQSAIDHALSVLAPFIDLVVKATFTDPVEALTFLKASHVDFVLLDVDMPRVDGISFMMQMPPEVRVILCTGYREYAVDAFEYRAVDYLMKPIAAPRFARSLSFMKAALKMHAPSPGKVPGDYYYFMLKGPVRYQRTRVGFAELVYIEARQGHTYFYLANELREEDRRLLGLQQQSADGKHIDATVRDIGKYGGVACLETLQDILQVVEGTSFMQIHKSYLFNMDYFRGFAAREVELKDMKVIRLPTGLRKNYPEFYDYLERQNLPEKD